MSWMISALILLQIFAGELSTEKIELIYLSVFLITLIIPVELNVGYALPKLLLKGKVFLFMLVFLILLVGGVVFNYVAFTYVIDFIFPDYFFISYYGWLDITKFFAVFMIAFLLIQISLDWVGLLRENSRLLQLEKESKEAELKALLGQINPHFLFNSLNVLYSLAINEKEKTSEAIVKLSDILRYAIYDAGVDTIPIHKELTLISNYLELQQYRISKEVDVVFNHDLKDDDWMIAPMLLLPLVENCFKHGPGQEAGKSFVHIKLNLDKGGLSFQIRNSKLPDEKEEHGGIGIQNLKKRLALLYPERHRFDIRETNDTFEVELKILNL